MWAPCDGLAVRALAVTLLTITSSMVAAKEIKSFKWGELDEDERARICHNFTVGDPARQELYSPLYNGSAHYPNNTECVRVIRAPYNHMVRLDFRDRFHLEESPTCEFDYLEIRNGAYAYSPLEDKLCGDRFPKPVQSEGRHLWLKFSSDASIEYTGFKAVYTYMPAPKTHEPPPEECLFNVEGSHGTIGSADIKASQLNHSRQNKLPLECTWSIRVKPSWQVYLTFTYYKLADPNNCRSNFIDIIAGEPQHKRLQHFCGTMAEPTRSETSHVKVRYYAEHGALKGANFSILFTAFREITSAESCDPETEFSCDDGWCIDVNLKCNHQYNCKYRYDEESSICQTGSNVGVVLSTKHMIVILVVFSALVVGMCASISITCHNKIQERRRREREYKLRRSKEASVEVGLDLSAGNLEAALALQAAEIGARRAGTLPPGVQATPVAGTAPILLRPEDDDNGCYVPEVDLSVFRKHPNGRPLSPATEA
ncbi:neuropilin and tolloid-like protein 2 [Ixodes scapularis]|uniref:neuropilin and tolloid-like protein 2 n=1 Tax=Ixodes scapularis TaxID=6945 RepID=UPI0011616A74|nr:neuropilin and tolloid-like protein 2 [Ixodes scapularis]